ncbi:NAD(P)H-quinone oxidoreductase [Mesorhizobium sp. YR577]|uniref:NAD(P)H-quinone oxidoreductase n=1 Tax=Mesorhizobium sp. YR577 TaxID=1884373 RepID=UPI0008EAC2DD|nr:NAD(P)H-quinone oxidoreductase [Mesorhizobium sp. YR577]SFU19423.1 putative NAD(P)H quinone oxidoreductase, PIG3 family [Mesorhizobium sp. YR577]
MRAVLLTRTGAPEVLEQAELPKPKPGLGEVVIAVEAAALNYADLMQRQGIYTKAASLPTVPGIECAGTIIDIGREVDGWRIGDRVCTLVSGGGYAEYVTVRADQLMPVPEGLDFITAAALPEAACTVWSNLIDICRLDSGESLLIHGGAGGIGSFAIQVAAARGSTVFATAGSHAKLSLCEELGASRAISYREEDFVTVVQEATNGHGADVILDNMGASYLRRNLDALAVDGRLAMIGLQGGKDVELSLGELFAKRASLFTTSLRDRPTREKARIVQGVLRDIWPLIASGTVRPVIDRTFALGEAAHAHRHMESGRHTGKIVLTVRENSNS